MPKQIKGKLSKASHDSILKFYEAGESQKARKPFLLEHEQPIQWHKGCYEEYTQTKPNWK